MRGLKGPLELAQRVRASGTGAAPRRRKERCAHRVQGSSQAGECASAERLKLCQLLDSAVLALAQNFAVAVT